MRTWPFGFGTINIPEHHSVGSSTGTITPSLSILFRSASAFGSSGIATFLGVIRAYGFAHLSAGCDMLFAFSQPFEKTTRHPSMYSSTFQGSFSESAY